jgi:uncharacterized protein involved in exopolysaccharide biosynthesis
MGAVLDSPWVANGLRRRIVLAALALVLAVLSVWPRPYLASTLLTPDDSAAGLSGLFGGGGGGNALAALLSGRGTIEADLLIGRSQAVVAGVAQRLHDQGRYKHDSLPRLEAKLRRKVDVEAVRGSVLQISTLDHDPNAARLIIEDYVQVVRRRLTELSRDQAVEKRVIARERMNDATVLLDKAQRTLNDYRAAHRFTGPDVQLGSAVGTAAGLQGQLEATKTTLLTMEQFDGPENIQVKATKDRVAVLERQIADIQRRGGAGGAASLSQLNPELTQYMNLSRDERYAAAEYDIYKRYLDALTVQEVAAPLNMDVIDPPYIDPERHFNAAPLGALALVLLLGVIAEFYLARPARPRD